MLSAVHHVIRWSAITKLMASAHTLHHHNEAIIEKVKMQII